MDIAIDAPLLYNQLSKNTFALNVFTSSFNPKYTIKAQ
jgi:hypothetical protein